MNAHAELLRTPVLSDAVNIKGQAVFQGCFCTWALEILLSKSLLSYLNLPVPLLPICGARLLLFPLAVSPGSLISHLGPEKSLV